jgi:hypothetical protein
VIDGFQFGGPLAVPAKVDLDITWEATGDSQPRGMGRQVPPTDKAAFLGSFATARSTGSFSGSALGFSFRSNPTPHTDQTFAEMGTAQNGISWPDGPARGHLDAMAPHFMDAPPGHNHVSQTTTPADKTDRTSLHQSKAGLFYAA